jgi:hypothetical protein
MSIVSKKKGLALRLAATARAKAAASSKNSASKTDIGAKPAYTAKPISDFHKRQSTHVSSALPKRAPSTTSGKTAEGGLAIDLAKSNTAKGGPSVGAGYDNDQAIPEEEKAAVSALQDRIKRSVELNKDFNTKTLPRWRKLVNGDYNTMGNSSVRTNLIYATQATLLPHVYAKDPDIAVSPDEACDESEYKETKEIAKSFQIALKKMLVQEACLKRRAKSGVRSAMSTSVGWFKLSFQHSYSISDPIIENRMNDMQDNLAKLEAAVQAAKETNDQQEMLRRRDEIRGQIEALQSQDEVKQVKAFVIDRVATENMFILDESIVEFDEYVNANELAQRVFVTPDEYRQMFGRTAPKGLQTYGAPNALTEPSSTKTGAKATFYALFEVWNKTNNTICVVAEGGKGYCKAPYKLDFNSQRWYPFFCLGFNLVEGRWRPMSDVELLEKLQEEYNETRKLFAETRREAIPVRFFRLAGNLTEEDINKYKNRKSGEVIGVQGNPQVPIKDDIAQLDGQEIDPAAFDVTVIRNDMDMMVGLSDASRANLIQAKTATEADIMRQALMTRVAERQDTSEDLISEMAVATLQIMLQAFTIDEIKQFLGPNVAWPVVQNIGGIPDLDEIFRKINVEVKAGSSGRPNQIKDRETWAQVLPILQEGMTKVAELRMAGQNDLAESIRELIKETLRRYDERIDVDTFIPPPQRDENGNIIASQGNSQAMAQLQQQLQQCQKELEQCKEALQKSQMDLQIAKYAENARIAEAQTTRAIETARVQATATADGQVQAVKAASQKENDQLKLQSELAKSVYIAALNAASTVMTKRMEPTEKKNADGSTTVTPGEDLSPEEIAEGMAVIVERIMASAPVIDLPQQQGLADATQ